MTTPPTSPAHTLFLSPQDIASMIARTGLATTLQGLARYIHQDFLRWKSFDKSARLAAHSPDGVIELMPIADASTYTFKYVNGHPKNTAKGLPTVMAFGVLADVASGFPLLISELTLTTALRTAATSAVAARALARPDSRVMALIGNGAQSEFQALAFPPAGHCRDPPVRCRRTGHRQAAAQPAEQPGRGRPAPGGVRQHGRGGAW